MELFSSYSEIGNEVYFIPWIYEDKFENSNGYKLSDIKMGDTNIKKPDLRLCRDPKTLKYDKKNLQYIRNKYPADKYPGYSSMVVESEEEMKMHIKLFQSVLLEHYSYGKSVNYLGNFPQYCCNLLSKNIFLSLLDKGYVNTTIFGDSIDNHAYIGVPFIYEDKQGFILMDGASEQLWKEIKNPPRSLMILIKGLKWEYKTQWAKGNPLYPNQFLNLQIFRTTNRRLGRHYSRRIDYYFRKICENPIKVKI